MRVLVLGDVIADVIVRATGPIAHGSDTRARISVAPGGSGANQAAWLAWLGAEVRFIGRSGSDPFGRVCLDHLLAVGVQPHVSAADGQASGLVVSVVEPSGERSLLTDRGANLGLRPRHLPVNLFRAGWHFHLSGYLLLYAQTRPAALRALRLARAAGMTLSVDPVAASLLAEVGAEQFRAWTAGAHLCLANADEARVLSGHASPEAAAVALGEVYQEVVVKLGAGGALWRGQAGRVLHAAARPAAMVDTTGAGDAFCGGFLYRWLAGASPASALAEGNRLGALAVSRPGARPPARRPKSLVNPSRV